MEFDAAAPGWRLVRTAGFTLVAAVLGVAGHLQASGQSVASWLPGAAAVPTALVGWWLSAGEPGLGRLGAGVLGVQLALHAALTTTASSVTTAHRTLMAGSPMAHSSSMAGMHLDAMAAAHVCSAVLAACWLRRGDRAVLTTIGLCARARRLSAAWWCYLVPRSFLACAGRRPRLVRPAPRRLHSLVSAACRIDRRGPPAALPA